MSWGPEDHLLGSPPRPPGPSEPALPQAPTEHPAWAEPPARVYERRTARREGREVAKLRCAGAGVAFTVECEVFPVNAMRTAPLVPGPYRFESLQKARAFLAEAVRALEYLGCDVADPDAPDERDAAAA